MLAGWLYLKQLPRFVVVVVMCLGVKVPKMTISEKLTALKNDIKYSALGKGTWYQFYNLVLSLGFIW